MRSATARLLSTICVSIMLGCADAPADVPSPTPPLATAGVETVVDSILPIEDEVRRFREGVGDDASILDGGATSRDELVASFVKAVETGDMTALGAAALDPAEFIDLYFPSSIYMKPPYQVDPAIIWFQMQNNSSRGLSRALARYGGNRIVLRGYTCPAEPLLEGNNRIWEGCVVEIDSGEEEVAEIRLFGPIMERAGRYKFLSYGNGL